MSDLSKIERRVRALLATAADREGTPEGDAARDKAFGLVAQYGLSESITSDGREVRCLMFSLAGAYTPQQRDLLELIAAALHCDGSIAQREGRGRIGNVYVFGVVRHIERVEMLFTILNPQMMVGAANSHRHGYSRTVEKRSWMSTFAAQIGARLSRIEANALGLADDGFDEDMIAAQELRDRYFPDLAVPRKRSQKVSVESMAEGRSTANGTNIGQTGVEGAGSAGGAGRQDQRSIEG